ncbi:RNA polymerase sigma-70 factor, ECF subfamily [Fodinibius roseus]|uniref:RNA polymerase sigma-70 factor, ECF subfamily n=1 Tax=Fodinibius roseus TaxID=1194090 RepID=A0A1M5DJU1_9BACT|nr:RNA polymerase sigma-70 factor [Fodinibius roseus]SHF67237.1 RNA polymerase sigma-70 factor, ECF subfamily [Fodinibius roseus]
MNKGQSDRQLLEDIGEGDRKAFEQLFNRHWESLFAVAMHRLQSEQLAKDVLQELFVELWEKHETLNIRSNVSGYLFTALKHRVINKIKEENTRAKYEKMTIRYYEINGLATEHQFSKNYLREEMEAKVRQLPDRCREVFELSRIEQLSHKEIGERLNISPKTVENHIGRALKVLRPYLKRVISVAMVFTWL